MDMTFKNLHLWDSFALTFLCVDAIFVSGCDYWFSKCEFSGLACVKGLFAPSQGIWTFLWMIFGLSSAAEAEKRVSLNDTAKGKSLNAAIVLKVLVVLSLKIPCTNSHVCRSVMCSVHSVFLPVVYQFLFCLSKAVWTVISCNSSAYSLRAPNYI